MSFVTETHTYFKCDYCGTTLDMEKKYSYLVNGGHHACRKCANGLIDLLKELNITYSSASNMYATPDQMANGDDFGFVNFDTGAVFSATAITKALTKLLKRN